MNVVCDVDLTVVRTDEPWWKDLCEYYSIIHPSGEEKYKKLEQDFTRHYDLSKYFPAIPEKLKYSFWSKSDLYDNLEPMEGSVAFLKRFSDSGYNVLFASYCKKGHFGSKYDWLKKHYPFMGGFFATKEKQYIKADIFIDDRNDMLNKRYQEDPKCLLVKFDTKYTQSEELLCPNVTVISDWK